MPTEIVVKYKNSTESSAGDLRGLFCKTYRDTPSKDNPLLLTNFNELLDAATQQAFEEGREFERKHPNLGR